MTLNFLLYLLFWAAFVVGTVIAFRLCAAFVVGTVIAFRLCAAAVRVMDETMPFGCPPQLRRLTWMLAVAWSISMFSEGILLSAHLLDPSYPPKIEHEAAPDDIFFFLFLTGTFHHDQGRLSRMPDEKMTASCHFFGRHPQGLSLTADRSVMVPRSAFVQLPSAPAAPSNPRL